MKTIRNMLLTGIALFILFLGDTPPDARFGFSLVPDAHAILGVWRRHARRWAVVGTAAMATTAAVEASEAAAQTQRVQAAPPPAASHGPAARGV